jgi:hypothetical protein
LNRQRRAEENSKAKLYYKPHFGPEETQEMIDKAREEEALKTRQQFNSLRDQLLQ